MKPVQKAYDILQDLLPSILSPYVKQSLEQVLSLLESSGHAQPATQQDQLTLDLLNTESTTTTSGDPSVD